ncbi:MAG: hypothetical protein MW689_001565 [Thermodesulfobacteria bacterium]|nr:hypothetical protein [Thermodesulfobacteriota bacterium]MCU4137994.1 hypothetical protein [Thermodesulfobacteriota bacterium]
MNKILKSIFLIIISLGFLVGIANAQELPFPFYVKFTDANENGSIDFTIYAINEGNQTLYTGVATTDHTTIYDPLLQIPAGSDNSTSVSWKVDSGESLIYDVYLTPNPENINAYYWTSQGDAFLLEFEDMVGIYISWKDTGVPELLYSEEGDDIYGVPVPIPSALWLLGSGAITLGLIRKKLLSH